MNDKCENCGKEWSSHWGRSEWCPGMVKFGAMPTFYVPMKYPPKSQAKTH